MTARISVVDSIGQLQKTAAAATAASAQTPPGSRRRAISAGDAPTESGRREQHQQRDERIAVAREHVEHDDAGGVGERHRVENPEPRSHRPGDEDAEQRQRHEDAEVSDQAAEAQRQRPLRVRLLALGVEHLGRVPEQRDLPRHQRQPRAGLRGDEVERLVGPVARHLRRREPCPPSARSASSVASCRSYSGAPRPKRSDW